MVYLALPLRFGGGRHAHAGLIDKSNVLFIKNPLLKRVFRLIRGICTGSAEFCKLGRVGSLPIFSTNYLWEDESKTLMRGGGIGCGACTRCNAITKTVTRVA